MKVGTDEPVIEIITWLFIGSGIFVSAVGLVGLIGTIRGSKIMLGFVSNTLKKLVILFDSAKKNTKFSSYLWTVWCLNTSTYQAWIDRQFDGKILQISYCFM